MNKQTNRQTHILANRLIESIDPEIKLQWLGIIYTWRNRVNAKWAYDQESVEWIYLFKFATICWVAKFPQTLIRFVKWIGQWIPSNDGRGITRNICSTQFFPQHLRKNGNLVETLFKTDMLEWVPRNFSTIDWSMNSQQQMAWDY